MKFSFAIVGIGLAALGMSQDVNSLTRSVYFASQDPHSLTKLPALSVEQQKHYSGTVIVLSGNNATIYSFSGGKRLIFVTEDKIFDDPKVTFPMFLRQNAGKDFRVGVPANSRFELPKDAAKLASFTGTLMRREDIGINQVFVLVKGKIVNSSLTNAMDGSYSRIIPNKKH